MTHDMSSTKLIECAKSIDEDQREKSVIVLEPVTEITFSERMYFKF